jgi:hypothetical protein
MSWYCGRVALFVKKIVLESVAVLGRAAEIAGYSIAHGDLERASIEEHVAGKCVRAGKSERAITRLGQAGGADDSRRTIHRVSGRSRVGKGDV